MERLATHALGRGGGGAPPTFIDESHPLRSRSTGSIRPGAVLLIEKCATRASIQRNVAPNPRRPARIDPSQRSLQSSADVVQLRGWLGVGAASQMNERARATGSEITEK